MHKQTCLYNKYLLTNNIVNVVPQDRVEVEVQKNCCKVLNLTLSLLARSFIQYDIEICHRT